MRRSIAASALVLVALGLLLGCAGPKPVPYGPIGDKVYSGYKDRQNADGGYTLLVVMPAYSAAGEIRAYWQRRAQELCPDGIKKQLIFRADKDSYTSMPYVYGQASVGQRIYTGHELEGYVYCEGEPKQPEPSATAAGL